MAINGSSLRLKIKPPGASTLLLVSEETQTSLDLTKDTFEVTSKDSGAWRNRLSSFKSAEIQCEAFIEYSPPAGHCSYAQLFAAYNGSASVPVEFTTDATGDYSLSGNFHVTKLTTVAPTEAGATVSFSLLSDGTVSGNAEPFPAP